MGVFGRAGEFVDTFVGEFYRAVLFVDNEVEGVGHLGHLAVVVLHVVGLGFEEDIFHALEREELDELVVFGQGLVAAEEEHAEP